MKGSLHTHPIVFVPIEKPDAYASIPIFPGGEKGVYLCSQQMKVWKDADKSSSGLQVVEDIAPHHAELRLVAGVVEKP